MLVTYIYDGSFQGLLTCIYEYYYSDKKAQDIKSERNYEKTLLSEEIFIKSSEEKSLKVEKAIENKISKEVLKDIYTVFLSEEAGFEMLILEYVKLGFKIGVKLRHYLHNPVVLEVSKCVKRVINEVHRLCGFVRFTSLPGEIYYASIEPDHNILTLLAPHFSARFSNQKWIIHDLKRELAILQEDGQWVLTVMERGYGERLAAANSGVYEDLWKSYYKTISIEERENPKLRRQMMPQRYWKHMTEFRD